MKLSKIILVVAALMVGMVGLQPAAQAALMDPVSFWLVDLDTDGSFSLDATHIQLGPSTTLLYSTDNTVFTAAAGNITISGPAGSFQQIFFQLDTPSNNNITSGDLTLSGAPVPATLNGTQLYTTASILWGGSGAGATALDILAGNKTALAASQPVPIPATALLLFTGLIGLIGFRRRADKR